LFNELLSSPHQSSVTSWAANELDPQWQVMRVGNRHSKGRQARNVHKTRPRREFNLLAEITFRIQGV
jgi:hypothetical protein